MPDPNLTTIAECLDKIRDYATDTKGRSNSVLSDDTLTGEEKNTLLAANIVECERIVEQVAIISAEITEAPHE